MAKIKSSDIFDKDIQASINAITEAEKNLITVTKQLAEAIKQHTIDSFSVEERVMYDFMQKYAESTDEMVKNVIDSYNKMTQAETKAGLIRSFASLNARHLANFAYHLERKTKIACGPHRWNVFCLKGYS